MNETTQRVLATMDLETRKAIEEYARERVTKNDEVMFWMMVATAYMAGQREGSQAATESVLSGLNPTKKN